MNNNIPVIFGKMDIPKLVNLRSSLINYKNVTRLPNKLTGAYMKSKSMQKYR